MSSIHKPADQRSPNDHLPIPHATGIHHIAYRCRDAEQTRWFYEDVLGLPFAFAFVGEVVPGLEQPAPFMHLFFGLGNGEFVAFFDQPSTASPEHFKRAHSFDRHIAIEVADEATLLEWQRRINERGVSCLGPIDHGFVKSVYMYDPNGLQVELTMRTEHHEHIVALEHAASRDTLQSWEARTRAEKETRLGAASLDLRERR